MITGTSPELFSHHAGPAGTRGAGALPVSLEDVYSGSFAWTGTPLAMAAPTSERDRTRHPSYDQTALQ